MSGVEPPWEELHHRLYFLPPLDHMEHEDYREILSQRVGSPMIPLSSPGQMDDGNMANISSMISINISRNPGTIENVYIGVDFYRLIFSNIPSYSRNSVIFLLGLMMRC